MTKHYVDLQSHVSFLFLKASNFFIKFQSYPCHGFGDQHVLYQMKLKLEGEYLSTFETFRICFHLLNILQVP